MEPSNLSSNWKKLQATLKDDRSRTEKTRQQRPTQKRKASWKRTDASNAAVSSSRKRIKLSHTSAGSVSRQMDPSLISHSNTTDFLSSPTSPDDIPNLGISSSGLLKQHLRKYVALDTESVGISYPPPKDISVVARVSLVSYTGAQIYDSYVRPYPEGAKVTDYRTHVSGIAAEHLRHGVARSFNQVQADVARLLDGRLLIGHALQNDLTGLMLRHPPTDVRDTARYRRYRSLTGGTTPSLRRLAKEMLGWEIQGGSHSSVVDARAAMALFRKDRVGMEAEFGGRGRGRDPKGNLAEVLDVEEDDKIERRAMGKTNKAVKEFVNGPSEEEPNGNQAEDSGDEDGEANGRTDGAQVKSTVPNSRGRRKKQKRKRKKGKYH
ncbi:3'-5' exonuclease [Thelotrema lepadinum]|nr:3'-5' exonuclease [Thelotrema lepadinum]